MRLGIIHVPVSLALLYELLLGLVSDFGGSHTGFNYVCNVRFDDLVLLSLALFKALKVPLFFD